MDTKLLSITPTDDFWSRQANAQTHSFEFAPYGIPAVVTANRKEILEAARLSARRYSAADTVEGRPIRIQMAVRDGEPSTLPADLTQQLAYSGLGDWITLAAGEWGHGFANLHTREACIFLSRTLAGDIRLVSRYFVDHYVLNFVLTEWAMLHASCVVDPRRQRLVVMVAAHNTGKSTTALRLMRAGYTFLADGMALFRRHGERVIVGGYPIGEVKLRDDVLAWFTGYSGEAAREQQKTIVDLRAVHPDRVSESLLTPSAVHVCFVDRGAGARTQVEPIDAGEAGRLISANTVFWNDAAHLKHNAETLRHLLGVAGLHRLRIGADESSLVTAIDELSE